METKTLKQEKCETCGKEIEKNLKWNHLHGYVHSDNKKPYYQNPYIHSAQPANIGMTKTLKQLLKAETYEHKCYHEYHKCLIPTDTAIDIFKEWLTQKRQEYRIKEYGLRAQIVNELLEELSSS